MVACGEAGCCISLAIISKYFASDSRLTTYIVVDARSTHVTAAEDRSYSGTVYSLPDTAVRRSAFTALDSLTSDFTLLCPGRVIDLLMHVDCSLANARKSLSTSGSVDSNL